MAFLWDRNGSERHGASLIDSFITLLRFAFLRVAFLPCATIRFPTDSGGHAT